MHLARPSSISLDEVCESTRNCVPNSRLAVYRNYILVNRKALRFGMQSINCLAPSRLTIRSSHYRLNVVVALLRKRCQETRVGTALGILRSAPRPTQSKSRHHLSSFDNPQGHECDTLFLHDITRPLTAVRRRVGRLLSHPTTAGSYPRGLKGLACA